jgi:hypothetical protein
MFVMSQNAEMKVLLAAALSLHLINKEVPQLGK